MQYGKKQIGGSSNSWPNLPALSSTEQWKATGKTELRKGSPRPSASASLSRKTELLCGRKLLMQVTKYSSTGITLDLKTLLCTQSPEVSPGHEDVLQLHRSLRHKAGVLSGRYFLSAIFPRFQQGFRFPSNMEGPAESEIPTSFLTSSKFREKTLSIKSQQWWFITLISGKVC